MNQFIFPQILEYFWITTVTISYYYKFLANIKMFLQKLLDSLFVFIPVWVNTPQLCCDTLITQTFF